MASLLYGAGLRLRECLKLRVKDVDFGYRQLVVRDGKGARDRVTMLPAPLTEALKRQIAHAREVHERDLAAGCGAVELPDALARKYPGAPQEFGWKFVFPSHKLSRDPRTGEARRHHLYENYLTRGVKEAARAAGMVKPVSCHTPAALLRYAPPRVGLRHPHGAGAPGPCGRLDDDDLHACAE